MDTTTIGQVKEILAKKWYRESQTLGEGGWEMIRRSGIDWKWYVLYEEKENGEFYEVETITADSDETAVKAFSSLYHMDMFIYWEIQERIVEYRLVGMKVEE